MAATADGITTAGMAAVLAGASGPASPWAMALAIPTTRRTTMTIPDAAMFAYGAAATGAASTAAGEALAYFQSRTSTKCPAMAAAAAMAGDTRCVRPL